MSTLPPEVVLATHNRGKLEEFERLTAGHPTRFVRAGDLSLPAPDETASTYLGNARIKARAAVAATGLPALADDTGLEVEILGGEPGVHTADFAAAHGGWARAREVLAERSGAMSGRRPAARAVCALVLAFPDGRMLEEQVQLEGHLVWPPVGSHPGFAAMFRAADAPFSRDGVLLHRRLAFEQLTTGVRPGPKPSR